MPRECGATSRRLFDNQITELNGSESGYAKRRREADELLVPWPAYKETNKWMIKLNFLVSKDRKYHQVYQASISQFRFESASRLAC